MALNISLSTPPATTFSAAATAARSAPLISSEQSRFGSSDRSAAARFLSSNGRAVKQQDQVSQQLQQHKRRSGGFSVARSSLETASPVVGVVTEVDKDTFWPLVNGSGDKAVVLDMYTQWCGPCKVMAPKYEKLSEEYLDVVFLKLDCNQPNKPLAKELGIRVVPTFKILKHGKVVKEVTGAKFDDLVKAIDSVRSS